MAKTARMKIDRTASQAAKAPSPLTTLMRTAVRTQADPVELAAFGTVDPGWAAASRRGTGRAPSTAIDAAQTRMTARVETPEPQPEPDNSVRVITPDTTVPGLRMRLAPEPVDVNTVPKGTIIQGRAHEIVFHVEHVPTVVTISKGDPKQNILTVASVTAQAVDHLWDWIRQDADGGAHFLGRRFTTSLDLHQYMAAIDACESTGTALMRVVLVNTTPIGFAMLGPILEGVGLLHLYLAQAARGRLAELTPLLVQAAQDLKPTLKLAVSSPTPAWARLHRQVLAPLGFREHTLFVR